MRSPWFAGQPLWPVHFLTVTSEHILNMDREVLKDRNEGVTEPENSRLLRFRVVPGVDRLPRREIVKIQIDVSEHLCQENDLSGVHREVFGDVKDRGQRGGRSSLNGKLLKQPIRIKTFEHTGYVCNRRFESSQQLRARDPLAGVKLTLSLTIVSCSAQAADNPLSRVPRKVQHQIADAVRFLISSPPDFVVS